MSEIHKIAGIAESRLRRARNRWKRAEHVGLSGPISRDTAIVSLRYPLSQKRSGDPNPQYFSKSTAVQMGGVLPYKWEAYCSTNGRRTAGFPFLRSLEASKVRRYKWGAYCRTNWRHTAVLFMTSCRSGKKKRAQRLSFWVRRPPGGVGVFHAKGWWPKTSCPPSKLCLPWVSKRGIRDVPGILPGCPGPLAVFKKFVQKNFVRIFRSLVGVGVSETLPTIARYFLSHLSNPPTGCDTPPLGAFFYSEKSARP